LLGDTAKYPPICAAVGSVLDHRAGRLDLAGAAEPAQVA
jgi:hypothetical protein